MIGSFLASSKVFSYGYGVVFMVPSSISSSEGTASNLAAGARAWSGFIKGSSSAAYSTLLLPVVLIKCRFMAGGLRGEGTKSCP